MNIHTASLEQIQEYACSASRYFDKVMAFQVRRHTLNLVFTLIGTAFTLGLIFIHPASAVAVASLVFLSNIACAHSHPKAVQALLFRNRYIDVQLRVLSDTKLEDLRKLLSDIEQSLPYPQLSLLFATAVDEQRIAQGNEPKLSEIPLWRRLGINLFPQSNFTARALQAST